MNADMNLNLVMLNALNHISAHIKNFPSQPLDKGCRKVVLDALKGETEQVTFLPEDERIALRDLFNDMQRLAQEAEPFIAKAYREGGVPTFPNASDWLDRYHALLKVNLGYSERRKLA